MASATPGPHASKFCTPATHPRRLLTAAHRRCRTATSGCRLSRLRRTRGYSRCRHLTAAGTATGRWRNIRSQVSPGLRATPWGSLSNQPSASTTVKNHRRPHSPFACRVRYKSLITDLSQHPARRDHSRVSGPRPTNKLTHRKPRRRPRRERAAATGSMTRLHLIPKNGVSPK